MNTRDPQNLTKIPQDQSNATIFQRSPGEVVQDSIAVNAMHEASSQPASQEKLSRSTRLNKKENQTQLVITRRNRTVPTTVHMDPILKRQLLGLAAGQTDRKLASFSAIAVALIRRGLLADPDKPYGPTLEPVIQGSIAKGMSRHDNRLASLQARTAYEAAQSRHLVTNCLNFLIAILGKLELLTDQGLFQRILDQSEQKAREALTKRDPDIMEMVEGTHVGTDPQGKGSA